MDPLFQKVKTATVDVDGEQVILREPGIRTGRRIQELHKDKSITGDQQIARVVAWCAINKDGSPRFTEDDIPALEDLPPRTIEKFSEAFESFFEGDDPKN